MTRLPPQIRKAAAAKMVWDAVVKANSALWIKRQRLQQASLKALLAYAQANSFYEKVCMEVSQPAHKCDTVRCWRHRHVLLRCHAGCHLALAARDLLAAPPRPHPQGGSALS